MVPADSSFSINRTYRRQERAKSWRRRNPGNPRSYVRMHQIAHTGSLVGLPPPNQTPLPSKHCFVNSSQSECPSLVHVPPPSLCVYLSPGVSVHSLHLFARNPPRGFAATLLRFNRSSLVLLVYCLTLGAILSSVFLATRYTVEPMASSRGPLF